MLTPRNTSRTSNYFISKKQKTTTTKFRSSVIVRDKHSWHYETQPWLNSPGTWNCWKFETRRLFSHLPPGGLHRVIVAPTRGFRPKRRKGTGDLNAIVGEVIESSWSGRGQSKDVYRGPGGASCPELRTWEGLTTAIVYQGIQVLGTCFSLLTRCAAEEE